MCGSSPSRATTDFLCCRLIQFADSFSTRWTRPADGLVWPATLGSSCPSTFIFWSGRCRAHPWIGCSYHSNYPSRSARWRAGVNKNAQSSMRSRRRMGLHDSGSPVAGSIAMCAMKPSCAVKFGISTEILSNADLSTAPKTGNGRARDGGWGRAMVSSHVIHPRVTPMPGVIGKGVSNTQPVPPTSAVSDEVGVPLRVNLRRDTEFGGPPEHQTGAPSSEDRTRWHVRFRFVPCHQLRPFRTKSVSPGTSTHQPEHRVCRTVGAPNRSTEFGGPNSVARKTDRANCVARSAVGFRRGGRVWNQKAGSRYPAPSLESRLFLLS